MSDAVYTMTNGAKMVEVHWNDANHQFFPQDAKALPTHSLGWLLRDDDDGVLIAQSTTDEKQFYDCLFIPRGMVNGMVELAVGDKVMA